MEPRSFAAAWEATQAFMGANAALLLPIGGAFIFLPQMLFQFGAQDLLPGQPVPEGAGFRIGLLVGLLLISSVIGQLTVTKMVAGHDRNASVGDTIMASLVLLLPAIAALAMQSIAIFAGLIVLIVPGLYLLGRLLFVLPVLACETRDPIEALKRSWALTTGNGFMLLSFILILILGIVAVSVLLGGLGAAIGVVSTVATGGPPVEGWGIGRWLFELVNVAVSSLMSVVYIIFVAQLYRMFRS